MKVPTITPELKAAAEELLGAQAYTNLIRPVVEGYQSRILAQHQFRIDQKWVERGSEDCVILDPKEVYLMNDADSTVIFAEYDAAAKANDFDLPDGYCPLLVAENMIIKAERTLLNAARYITNIDPDEFWDMKIRKELIDLTLNFVVASAGITTASVLSKYR